MNNITIERKDISASGNIPKVTFVDESKQKLLADLSTTKTSIKYKYICASKCKKFALEFAKQNRAHPFTRVGSEFLMSCEVALKNHIISRIKQHPSVGKTLT